MQPEPHFEWFSRSMLMVTRHLLQQLPHEYQVAVDSDMFLKSMSFVDKGVRKHGQPWKHAPRAAVHQPVDYDSSGKSVFDTPDVVADARNTDENEISERARAARRLKNEFYPAVAAGIPSAPNEWPENPMEIGKLRTRGTSTCCCCEKLVLADVLLERRKRPAPSHEPEVTEEPVPPKSECTSRSH